MLFFFDVTCSIRLAQIVLLSRRLEPSVNWEWDEVQWKVWCRCMWQIDGQMWISMWTCLSVQGPSLWKILGWHGISTIYWFEPRCRSFCASKFIFLLSDDNSFRPSVPTTSHQVCQSSCSGKNGVERFHQVLLSQPQVVSGGIAAGGCKHSPITDWSRLRRLAGEEQGTPLMKDYLPYNGFVMTLLACG